MILSKYYPSNRPKRINSLLKVQNGNKFCPIKYRKLLQERVLLSTTTRPWNAKDLLFGGGTSQHHLHDARRIPMCGNSIISTPAEQGRRQMGGTRGGLCSGRECGPPRWAWKSHRLIAITFSRCAFPNTQFNFYYIVCFRFLSHRRRRSPSTHPHLPPQSLCHSARRRNEHSRMASAIFFFGTADRILCPGQGCTLNGFGSLNIFLQLFIV